MPKASGKARQSVKTQQREKPTARDLASFREAHKSGTLRSAGVAAEVWWHSCPRTRAVAFLSRRTEACGRCGLEYSTVVEFLREQDAPAGEATG